MISPLFCSQIFSPITALRSFHHYCSQIFSPLPLPHLFPQYCSKLPYPSKMVPSLVNMPVDLLYAVIDEVERPAGLLSLCLVSKMMFAVAVVRLYRELFFSPMTPEAAERICIALANSDGLLLLVKTFRLGICLRHCSVRLEAAFLRLLSKFPDHSICSFILDGHFLRPSHQEFLWSHQRRIYDLRLTAMTDGISQQQTDHTMGRRPSSLRVLGMVNSFFRHSSIISQRMLPIANLIHLTLENVFIDGLSLDSIPHLTHLAFRNCPASSMCLKRFTSPNLKALYIYYDPVEWNVLSNLNTFLSSFRGLETLAVRDIWSCEATRQELRGVAGLANAIELHRDTLSFLSVHFNPMVYNNPYYHMPILRAINECINLRQVGLSLSPKRLEETCLTIIANLPLLVTLRIDLQRCLNFVSLWHQNPFAGGSGYGRIFGAVAGNLMTTAVTIPGQSNFSLLSIGVRVASTGHLRGCISCSIDRCPGGSCECSHGIEIPDAYVFRRRGTLAHRIMGVEAKNRIPESDIIDFRYQFF